MHDHPTHDSPPTSGRAPAVVVIPARGGSRGVPRKNLQHVGGSTLVGRAVDAARAARSVGQVVVSTDDAQIAAEARRHGAHVVLRPAQIAGDLASSESAVLHALDTIAVPGTPAPEVTVLVQCTSPFLDPRDLDAAVDRVVSGERDVVVAVAPTHDFQWRADDDAVRAVGHSVLERQRRQDRAPHYRETGAFYAMRTAGLRETGRRFFGEVGLHAVDPVTAVEIDDRHDLWWARQLATLVRPGSGAAYPALADLDALVTDFDGVHTDDHALVDLDGTEHVRVHRGDGLGIAAVRDAGLPFLILSTEQNAVVTARATKLRVDVLQGVDDKASALAAWLAERDLDPARVAYVGNDVNDLPALRLVGWPVAVADAHPDVIAAARLVLTRRGGDGAVRETCDALLGHLPEPRPAHGTGPDPAFAQHLDPHDVSAATLAATHNPTDGRPRPMSTTTTPRTPETMPAPVAIGDRLVGDGQPVYVIGEIGLNHNGDVEIAKQLVDVAAAAGAQAVKFQKRTPEISTPADMRDVRRETPWGEMSYLEYRYRVEFEREEYEKVAAHAADRGLQWFASPWDVPSVEFLEGLDVPTHKVASASVTDHELLRALADTGKPIILSTGMSTLEEIDAAVEVLGTDGLVMLHATSTYPLPPEEANLRVIETLRARYGVPVGYSGHERGLQISLAAVALGAVAVERHITLDRTMWGSDQASSLEPTGLEHLVRDIRILEQAMGDGTKRVFEGELKPKARLRRVDSLAAAAAGATAPGSLAATTAR
ncbi:N-acetylneuraminate synthase family protein [Cellulosimicrobium terreum]|nr:N-acetylneuraminate synthase family protein [Cellulosimicrobium terreum]